MAALAGGLPASLGSQGTPAQTPPQNQTPGTGLILGQVVDAGTGQPIAGAMVTLGGGPIMLNGQPLSVVEAAALDPGGRGGGGTRVLAGPLGQFVFHSLRKGTYRLQASAAGYVPAGYGQRRVDGQIKPLELDEGEHVGDATIKLWKYAAMSGRVTDDAGEPAVGVTVRILRAQAVGVARALPTGAVVQTDDRGVYRAGTLIPGDYIVAIPQSVTTMPVALVDAYYDALRAGTTSTLVRELSQSNAPFPNQGGPGMRVGDYQVNQSNSRALPAVLSDDRSHVFAFATTFYPAATIATDATVLKLASGQDQSGVDLQLRLVRTTTVSGAVSAPDGPARNTGVRLIPSGGVAGWFLETGFEAATTATDANGAFTFLGVPPGQYTLRVQRVPRPQFDQSSTVTILSSVGGMSVVSTSSNSSDVPPPPPSEPTLYADVPVSVADRDVPDLAVTLREGARVSGKIVFEGSAAAPTPQQLQRMTVNLSGIDFVPIAFSQGSTKADGQFTTTGYPPGRYFVNVSAPGGPGWTLQSVTLGGRNLDESPLELQTSDVGGIVITFTDHASELRGTIRAPGASTTADPDAMVIVFPANYRDWIDQGMSSRRQRTASVGKSGAFTMTGLPPGDYLAAAVSIEAIDNPRDPKVFDALARVASRVTLTAGEKKSIDLTVAQIR